MRLFKSHPLLKLVNSYIIDSPQPSNLSYLWNFGSLLALCLVIQVITGVTLAMHYNPSVIEAFNSVEHIMRDVNNGWFIRYLHSNTASAFFFIVYLHIGRGLYYGSYKAPRTLVWTIGTVIFILMMATAFLGYVLPYGQMSLWGATVITNLMSAIPWVGQDIVEFIWGGFSVNHATLNRFFALHFVLPFLLAALALMHLITLHDSAGSGNPLGVSGNSDRLPFAPYFIFKDLITIFIFFIVLAIFVFFMPNFLGDSENYVMANPMQTPPAIVPEWYLLPFYAILRSIPNKLLGVIAMFSAILILLIMPFADLSRSRGIQFRPISKIAFFIFIGNFLILMQLGAEHVESPFLEFGQISTVLYFAHFLIIIPVVGLLENSLVELFSNKNDESTLSSVTIARSGPGSGSVSGSESTISRTPSTSSMRDFYAGKSEQKGVLKLSLQRNFGKFGRNPFVDLKTGNLSVYGPWTNTEIAHSSEVFESGIGPDLKGASQNDVYEYFKSYGVDDIEYKNATKWHDKQTKPPTEKMIKAYNKYRAYEDNETAKLQERTNSERAARDERHNALNAERENKKRNDNDLDIDRDNNNDNGSDNGVGGSPISIPSQSTSDERSAPSNTPWADRRSYYKAFVGIMLLLLSLVLYCVHLTVSELDFTSLTSSNILHCDAPRPWGIYFQDSASPQMEALVELHDNILFYLVIILFGVGWMLLSIAKNYKNIESPLSLKYLSHGTLIELIWTITPSLILILIAFPSFKLLYLMDEVSDPAMAVLAEGHQWYWSYQYPDFLNSDQEFIEYDSYLVPESDLQDGALRMLEVDNRLIMPELTHVRFIVTGADVIHCFACPALGIKCDAYPGRLNQTSVMINREGVFYGQCSEICGILHSSMPIVIESVSIAKFVSWLMASLIFPLKLVSAKNLGSCLTHHGSYEPHNYVTTVAAPAMPSLSSTIINRFKSLKFNLGLKSLSWLNGIYSFPPKPYGCTCICLSAINPLHDEPWSDARILAACAEAKPDIEEFERKIEEHADIAHEIVRDPSLTGQAKSEMLADEAERALIEAENVEDKIYPLDTSFDADYLEVQKTLDTAIDEAREGNLDAAVACIEEAYDQSADLSSYVNDLVFWVTQT